MTLLRAALPLRLTTVWDGFAVPKPIPHRYGRTTGALLPYDETGLTWCWADHACASIEEVTIDGQPAGPWQWRNTTDSTGHAVALVLFGQPQDRGTSPVATGQGKLHSVTGALLTSPADVLWDALANIAGLPVTPAMLDDFRRDCAAHGLVCAGSIDAADSAQTVARSVCASVGAIFCGTSAPVAVLWPDGAEAAARATVDALATVSAQSTLDDLANDLTLNFDFADGAARAALQLEAPDSVRRYGRRAVTLDAPWIAAPRVAYDVAARMLAQQARPQWSVTASGLRGRRRVGDTVHLAHPGLPVAGKAIVQSADFDFDQAAASITALMTVGDHPAVRLVRQSSQYAPQVFTQAGVQTVGNERVLTLLDTDGSPLAGASVTLDAHLTRTSDGAGRVFFPVADMGAGQHTLDIVTIDGRALNTTVLVQ